MGQFCLSFDYVLLRMSVRMKIKGFGMQYKWRTLLLIPVLLAVLAGCGPMPDRLGSMETLDQIVEENQSNKAAYKPGDELILTLFDSFDRAITENLDVRLSAFELVIAEDDINLNRLAAYPQLDYSFNYLGRSNLGASSSKSILSGNQSLEPSISTDRHRNTTDLDLRWNIIDIALAAVNTKSAQSVYLVQQEKHRQVIQTVISDVQAAYLRSWIAQRISPDVQATIADLEKSITNVQKARDQKLLSSEQAGRSISALTSEIDALKGVMEQVVFAEAELRALLSIPQFVELTLLPPPDDILSADIAGILARDMGDLEIAALRTRPEMREVAWNIQSAQNDINAEIIRSIPGAEIFLGYNTDTNSFLQDSQWFDFSASIVQKLMALATLPQRYEAAENKKEAEKIKATATATAIVTQVHLARHRLALEKQFYEENQALAKSAEDILLAAEKKHAEGFISGQERVMSKAKALGSQLRAHLANADLHDAVLDMHISLGELPYRVHHEISDNQTIKQEGHS